MDKLVNGCLFVGRYGLFAVYCDFQVVVLFDVHKLRQGDLVMVSAVKSTPSGRLVYQIGDHHYYHHYFALMGP
jgi:hypothetical protein